VCILGPSGCGKTTFLRIIASLIPFDQGTIRVGNQDILKNRDYLKDIAMVFQEPRLLPWRTARENVRLSLELKKGNIDDQDKQGIENAIALVGLSQFGSAFPHELSGGMRQRIALARALVTQPKILLMDEPLTGLDLRTREELQDEIINIWTKKRITLVLVTHDSEEAIHLADRIIVLSSRPTHIKGVIAVPLARPRERNSTVINELKAEIRKLFAEEAQELPS
jgi:ABC-type nitrate/sulfonate/bicarbonate transport system ATPase subunit